MARCLAGAEGSCGAVSTGYVLTLGRWADGSLWAWGDNGYGQLGVGDSRNIPTQVGTDFNWVAVTAGYYHSLGLKADGTLWSWGGNDYGQLGVDVSVAVYLNKIQKYSSMRA